MVGPSVTEADRERFLRRLKIGFALFVGVSMGLVTTWGGADLSVVAAATAGGALVGGLLAQFTFPDSIAETPYDEEASGLDRGPKPGERTRQRRADERTPRAADGEGERSRRERDQD